MLPYFCGWSLLKLANAYKEAVKLWTRNKTVADIQNITPRRFYILTNFFEVFLHFAETVFHFAKAVFHLAKTILYFDKTIFKIYKKIL